MKDYQVTLLCINGKYKPVSCIIKHEEVDLTDKDKRKELINLGTKKIAEKRLWSAKDVKNYGYLKAKVRIYDKVAIAIENKANYEAIKEKHYTDGTWQRPKSQKESD